MKGECSLIAILQYSLNPSAFTFVSIIKGSPTMFPPFTISESSPSPPGLICVKKDVDQTAGHVIDIEGNP